MFIQGNKVYFTEDAAVSHKEDVVAFDLSYMVTFTLCYS
jgi:hypothetical protein